MNAVENILHPDHLRAALGGFWQNALTIEATHQGLAVALPQTGADGWQLVIDITAGPPGTLRLSDAGRTLGGLMARGQNIEAETLADHVATILRQSQVERDGVELFRWLKLPLDPPEVHVFVEALAAVSHLWVLHEPTVRPQDVADRTLRRVFSDRQLEARAGAMLDGKTEKRVRVDYLVAARRPVAFEILRRRGRLLPVMEQWGYRWQDLQKISPQLMPVMLYDPASQEVDDASRAIGEDVCSLFCAYDQTERIHAVLTEATA
jgi:hypothetical protein